MGNVQTEAVLLVIETISYQVKLVTSLICSNLCICDSRLSE